ncbi:MAG: hypothetical protein WD533_02185 [Dehalococcoidia bacterium]
MSGAPFKTTWYFDNRAKRAHPEARREDWVQHVLDHPVERRPDRIHSRTRLYGYIRERRRYMRVVIDDTEGAVHNAFFDSDYKPGWRRRREAKP